MWAEKEGQAMSKKSLCDEMEGLIETIRQGGGRVGKDKAKLNRHVKYCKKCFVLWSAAAGVKAEPRPEQLSLFDFIKA